MILTVMQDMENCLRNLLEKHSKRFAYQSEYEIFQSYDSKFMFLS